MTSPISSPVDLTLLKGKNVIITGGASGLGLALAEKWAASGAYVTIADVQDNLGQEAVKKIKAAGGQVNYVHCDTTDWKSSDAAFKNAVNFGPNKTLDVAALFAGVLGPGINLVDHLIQDGPPSMNSTPPCPHHKSIDINLTGVWYSAYLALHYFQLKPQGSGATNGATPAAKKSLVFMSSLAGYVDYPNNTAYGASKFGVRGLWRSVRSRAPELGVRTNLLAPWFVDTPLVADMKADLDRRGVQIGKGWTWAAADTVVEAASKCAVEEDIDQRAFAVMPEGYYDLQDDLQTGHGGAILGEIVVKRLEAGDQLA